jgi:hypothetical protein
MHIKETISYWLNYCLLIGFLLTACMPEKDRGKTQEIASPTPLPAHAPSAAGLAATLIADPQYMKDCKTISAPRLRDQQDYLEIFPGQSTDEDVKTRLGNPREQNHFEKTEEWVYGGFNIYIEDGVVSSIEAYEDAQIMVNLSQLNLEYGCPDLILAIDTSIDRPTGNYDLTKFIYLNNGIEFVFLDFPVSLADNPTSVVFFMPQSAESYLEQSHLENLSLENGKPVWWGEAVK